MYIRYPVDVTVSHIVRYFISLSLSYIYYIYLKKVLVRQTKWLDQIPRKSGLWIKITEYLEGLSGIVNHFVQSRHVDPSFFVLLATSSQLNLAVFSNELFRTRTVVPNAGGLTDFIAGSSIQTRIVLTAAIGARDVTNTGSHSVVLLVKKKAPPPSLFLKILCIFSG